MPPSEDEAMTLGGLESLGMEQKMCIHKTVPLKGNSGSLLKKKKKKLDIANEEKGKSCL